MRRLTDFVIICSCLSIGAPYGLQSGIWVLLASASVGLFWLLQSRQNNELGLNFSFLFLGGACAAGIFFDHSPIWSLTNMIILLAAWNLDRFRRDGNIYSADMEEMESEKDLFHHRLKRLGIVSLFGWGLGLVALNIRVDISFSAALVLGSVLVISLGMIFRLLREDNHREGPSGPMGP